MNRLGWLTALVGLLSLMVMSASALADTATLGQDCRESALRLQKQLGPECRLLVRPPLVIGGDFSIKELEGWYVDTIQPAARAMQTSYFKASPTQAVTVLVFSSAEMYERFSWKLFHANNVSIYGYYKPDHRTLMVNLSTGGGTLVHELTHALIDFDFPGAPAWFNEGLASLHEACRFRASPRGTWLEGTVNWRLKGLQVVIRQRRMRSIASMIQDPEFRGSLEGANYAHARYLCLYLQQRGLLEPFYREFRDHRTSDPQGLAALERVLGEADWRTLDEDFQAWALALVD